MLYWLIIIKLFSCRKGPFCGRLWLLVLHSVYVRMRHPGLRRPYFDVPDASIRTLHEAWHSLLHIKDHATGRANWLESDGYLLHIRLIRSRIMWVSHPLFVCYYTNVGFLSHQMASTDATDVRNWTRLSDKLLPCVNIESAKRPGIYIWPRHDMTLMCMIWHEVIER